MNFVLQTPSLQHLAGVKTVTELWNQWDIFTQIAQSFNGQKYFQLQEFMKPWEALEEKVRSKISDLPLPHTCKKELLNFIKPIGMEIIAWCHYHNLDGYSFKSLENLLPRQFRWSMHGTIDYAKTAESMVKDERLSVERRFEFACLNCLEDEARELIELIPNHRIHKYITEAIGYWRTDPRILRAYFACTLSGDVDLLDRLFQAMDLRGLSVNQYLFKAVSDKGPRATCAYFSRIVSQAEKEQVYLSLPLRWIQWPTCGLMFCLSLMNEEQQQRLFPQLIYSPLMLLFHWPMQPLFMELVKRLWPFMDNDDCADVLDDLISKICFDFHDYDYIQLFKECWRLNPAAYKQSYLNDIDRLEMLFESKRRDLIQLVFNEAPSLRLKELVESRYDRISRVLMDERVICDAALMECKEKAALDSTKDRNNVGKRLRSEYVGQLVDKAMESRIKRRETCRCT